MVANIEARLLQNSIADDGCLRWTGGHSSSGYGRVDIQGKRIAVHRVAYELWVGPIPPGFEVDHVRDRGCRFRDCIRPDHLEPVTQLENLRRGHRHQERILSEGLCLNGHSPDMTPEAPSVCTLCRRAIQQCDLCGVWLMPHNVRRHQRRVHDEVKAAERKAKHDRALEVLVAAAATNLKAACKRGHPFDDANTGWTNAGTRRCRTCKADWMREKRQHAKAGAA